ncbi:MAG: serine/threonine-protein kinase [Gemmatimonadaceae bacterium]
MRNAVEALLAADAAADERLTPLKLGISDVLERNLASRSPVADSLRLAGQLVSHFRIIEPIGAGGMGIVYRAQDTRLNRQVALKLPLASVQVDSKGRARFLREAHAVGALDHPNVCSVYEAGESEEGRLFLAMALYTGEPLKSRIAREGPLAVGDALAIARQVSAGLECAHSAGVTHRDLKPGNIMLTPDGTVKILDFGLAKLSDLGDTVSNVGGLGTACYMSPEQVRGQTVDGRSDLWSLGVLLYEMLTGVRPFTGGDPVSIAHAILHGDTPHPSDFRPTLPRGVDQLVMALLQKDPGQRYASAAGVTADICAIQRGAMPAISHNVANLSRVWLRMRTRRAGVALFMLAAGIIFVGTMIPELFAPSLASKPTRNRQAYQFYLRGRDYERRGPVGAAAADSLYRRAVAVDKDFALPWARLAVVHMGSMLRPNAQRLEQARQEATAALRLRPGLADAHYALGLYWERRHQNDRALTEFAKARKGLGQSAELYAAMGNSFRSLGRLEEAVTAFERALDLDPVNIIYAPSLAVTYGRLRRYRESASTWGRYIALTPDDYHARLQKGYLFTRWKGTPDTLAAALRQIPADWDPRGITTFARVYLAQFERRPAEVVTVLAASRHSVSEDFMIYRPHSLLRAAAYAAAGDPARARSNFDSARIFLQDSVVAHPDDFRLHVALGMALAGLGQKDGAIRAAQRAMDLKPLSADVVRATCSMGGAAEIFAALGENDAAIRLLDRLLRLPAGREASVPLLRRDPAYDRLRDDPRFQRMLERYSTD